MKKHLQQLLLFMALCVPWMANAQQLSNYTYSTGVDASKWVQLSSTTSIIVGTGDSKASSLQNIGFAFPFGEESYTQFSVNSDGNLRLGGIATGTGSYTTPFSSSNANTNSPKINMMGCDGYITDSGHVYAELIGTAPNRTLVVEFATSTYSTTSRASVLRWQVQLSENGDITIAYPSSLPPILPAVTYQKGLCVDASDVILIDADHAVTAYSSGSSAACASGTWPDVNRYYSFVRPIVTCPSPNNFFADNITSTSADISWHERGSASVWTVEYAVGNFVPGTGQGTVISSYDSVVSLTNLDPNTVYTVYIHSDCGAGDTSFNLFGSFRTACGLMTSLPFFEDFENQPTGTSSSSSAFIPCWFHLNNGTSSGGYPYVTGTSSYNHTLGGTKGLYWYATTTTGAYGDYYAVVLPTIDTDLFAIDELQLRFYARATAASYNPVFYVGVMGNPDSISTFQPMDTIYINGNVNWTEYESSLAGFEGYGANVAIMALRPTALWYACIDDITLEKQPACPHVVDLAYDFVSDGVEVSWTEVGDASSWELAAITSNNTALINDEDVVYAYEESYTFSNLVNGTTYYIFVRPDCGEEVSWYGPITVTPGSINMPATGTQSITGCGITVYDNGGATLDYSTSCNGYLTVYPAAPDSLISFYGSYSTESPSWDWLVVYEGENASGNVLFDQRDEGSSAGFIDTMTSTVGPITIWFKSDGSTNDDGFELHTFCSPAPNCGDVTNITSQVSPNSALVSWTPGYIGEYTGATVEYRMADDSTAEWVALDPTSETFIGITGLTPSTNYDVRVQSTCSDGDGNWVLGQFMTKSYDCILMDSSSLVQDTIGNGSTTSSYYPTYSFYNYSVSQQIYLASDFDTANMGGVITKIGFQLGDMVSNRDWNIFVTLTNQTNLTNAFIPISASDLVWSGNTSTFTANAWNEIALPSPITLNGSNILVTFQDMTGSYTSGNQGIVTNTSIPGISRYIYQDSGPYDPTSAITDGTATTDRLNMYFYGGTCLQQQTCAAPIVRAEGTDIDQITLNWVPGNAETSWNVYYRAAADSVYTLAGTATANTYVLNNLQPSSQYFFKVASVCGSDEGAAAELDCWTACGLTPTPFFEDFENVDYGEFSRPCWKSGTTNMGTDYPYPTVISLTGDPNKLLLFYNGGYLVLPEFDAPLNTLQARFTLVQGVENVRLMIGLLENLDDPISSITPLDTLIRSEIDSANSSVIVTYPFDFLPDSTHGHIVFFDAWSDNYSFIDNLYVEPIPNCTSVTGVTTSNISANSADIAWSEGGDLASGYLLEYGPHHFALGSGTQISTTSNVVSLTGLNSGTTYDVYVYAVCSSTGDTSAVSNVAVFATQCAPLTLPYTENFDNVLEPGSGSSTKQLPNCWNYVMTNSSYSSSSYYPTAYYTTTSTYTTSGQYCLYLYGEAVTVLPEMPTTVDSLMISFHKYTSSSSYQLIVGAVDSVTPDFENSFVGLDTLNSNVSDVTLFLNNYTGTGRYIAFKNINTSGSGYSYHYIDDIAVEYVPSCIYPVNFSTASASTTSADIIWTTSNADDYEYEYGPTGFTRGTGTTGTCIGRLASITGLTISTTYDIYVRGICGPGDTSDWKMYTFHTLNADPAVLPYSCDFSDTTLVNAGFEVVNGNNAWYVGNVVSNGTPNSLYISNDNGVSNAYTNSAACVSYAFRDITIPGGEISFGFDWQANGESSYDYIRAWLAPVGFQFSANQLPDGTTAPYDYTNSTPSGWISLDGGGKLNLNSSWQSVSNEIMAPAGTYHLVFMWVNDGSAGSNPPAAIDNVYVMLNTCPKVQNLQAINITASSMDITWTDTVAGLGWQVEYGPAGFIHGDPTATSAFTTQSSYTMSGLTSLTPYDVYVRHVCSATDTGMWRKLSVQSDICDNPSIAITYGDTTASASTTSYSPGYSLYNYSYSETIIDSAELAEAGITADITAFAFHPASATSGDYFSNCDVYLGHTSASSFSSGSLYDTSFVLVYSGDLNYYDDNWQTFGFDTPFAWNGHSNVVLVVNRRHGAYQSGSSFHSHSTSSAKTYYDYQDDAPFVPGNNDGSLGSFRADYQLISCAEACAKPVIVSETHDYQSSTINWTGDGDLYEVDICTFDGTYGTPVAVSGNTYTFNGLQPATTYLFRVRQDCNADELGFSDWAEGSFTTDSLPCFAPEALAQTAATYRSVTLSWTAGGEESHWQVRVYSTTFDSIYDAATTTATVSGLQPGITYNATVRALCGSVLIPGDWSDAISVTTADCLPVSNVRVTNVTAQAATITWTAGGSENAWVIEYSDMPDFATGTGTIVNAGSNPFDLPLAGFEPETEYYFYVYAQCDASLRSVASNRASFTTQNVGIDDVDATRSVSIYPNPATHAATLTLSGVDGQLHIDIVDMNGRKVQSFAAVADGGLTTTLDLSTLAQGAYFVRIYGDNFSSVKKLVVR